VSELTARVVQRDLQLLDLVGGLGEGLLTDQLLAEQTLLPLVNSARLVKLAAHLGDLVLLVVVFESQKQLALVDASSLLDVQLADESLRSSEHRDARLRLEVGGAPQGRFDGTVNEGRRLDGQGLLRRPGRRALSFRALFPSPPSRDTARGARKRRGEGAENTQPLHNSSDGRTRAVFLTHVRRMPDHAGPLHGTARSPVAQSLIPYAASISGKSRAPKERCATPHPSAARHSRPPGCGAVLRRGRGLMVTVRTESATARRGAPG